MNETNDGLIDAYLGRLDAAAWVLPPDRRAELVEEIRTHIDEAIAGAGSASEVTVRNTLDRLGPPEEIVQAASLSRVAPAPTAVARRPRGIGMEIAAVVLLLIGGVVVPVLGWFIGLALLLASPRWTIKDKLLGALVWPLGLSLPLLIALFTPLTTTSDSCAGPPVEVTAEAPAEPTLQCETVDGAGGAATLMPIALLAALAAQVVVAVYLLVRARRRADTEWSSIAPDPDPAAPDPHPDGGAAT